uniref:Uncharacterized protein n=1 Tax=Anguilla anguilla TaxID=7936 RepID=A0A0E9UKY0_ANGAN
MQTSRFQQLQLNRNVYHFLVIHSVTLLYQGHHI